MTKQEQQLLLPDFLIVPYQIVFDEHLQPLDKFLYGVIYWYQHLSLKKCVASNAELARTLKTTATVIQNCLNRLETQGYIQRVFYDEKSRHRKEIRALVRYRGLSSNDDQREEKSKKSKSKDISLATHGVAGREINLLLEKSKSVNPSYEQLFKRSPQRAALARRVQKYGTEKVGRMIASLPVTNAEQYAPTITTPYELEANLGKLIAFLQRKKRAMPSIVKILPNLLKTLCASVSTEILSCGWRRTE